MLNLNIEKLLIVAALVGVSCRPIRTTEIPVPTITPGPCLDGEIDSGSVDPDGDFIPANGDTRLIIISFAGPTIFTNRNGHACGRDADLNRLGEQQSPLDYAA